MTRLRVLTLAVGVACSVGACGDSPTSPDGSEGAAVAACRSSLQNLADKERMATTVRNEGDGYVVNAWRASRAEGVPDWVCTVVRDRDAERGVSLVEVRPSPAR